MAVTSALMTVAEFSALPQPQGGVRQELHHGEVFEMAPVKLLHTRIQRRLVRLLEAALPASSLCVDKEFPFRPEPEHEVWVADVAVFGVIAESKMYDDDYYHGVPEVVIEVLSPSNTASEMLDRELICLRNGGREFWLVDPARATIKIVQPDGRTRVFSGEDVLNSPALGVSIATSAIFAD